MAKTAAQLGLSDYIFKGTKVRTGRLRAFPVQVPMFDVHQAVEDFNQAEGTKLKVVRPELADMIVCNGLDHFSGFEATFVTDRFFAYDLAGGSIGKEIVYDTGAYSKVVLPTGRFHGADPAFFTVRGLKPSDFRRDGRDVYIDIDDSRIVALPISLPVKLEKPDSSLPHIIYPAAELYGEGSPNSELMRDRRLFVHTDSRGRLKAWIGLEQRIPPDIMKRVTPDIGLYVPHTNDVYVAVEQEIE